jgi:sRNA-binding carbon storage regulator CsrA
MALVIGVTQGATVFIDDVPLTVVSIAEESITVSVQEQKFILSPYESTEVLPKVFVSVGVSHRRRGEILPRLLFEAPRSIAINRKELYEQHQKIPPIP